MTPCSSLVHHGMSINCQVSQSRDRSSPRGDWGEGWGRHEELFSRDPVPVFSAEGHREQFWHGQECPLFHVVHPAFPLPTTVSPILQGAFKDGFGAAVVACDMPEPCKFPSLVKRWSWDRKPCHACQKSKCSDDSHSDAKLQKSC